MIRNSFGQYVKINPKDRFWDKVKKTNYCWEWTGRKRKDGYGTIWIEKSYRAHRFVMEMKFGKLSPKIKVLHKCDNPACVRPDHLFLGSQRDNVKDMIKKRRNIYFCTKGIDNPQAKLNQKQVDEIRKKYVPYHYSTQKLAKEYGLAQQSIWKIVKGKRYG